jgi:diaminopimelate decarboxylase
VTFQRRNGQLHCEGVDLAAIAGEVGTPCYVYSATEIAEAWQAYDDALGDLPHQVCYAVKANSSLAVLALLAKRGAGFDIVSGGELFRVLKAGGDPAKVVFSGVGKTRAEIDFALQSGVGNFNCESEAELAEIDAAARAHGVIANFSMRVNPDVDAVTHPYISTGLRDHKFGIDIAAAPGVYERSRAYANLRASGVSCHIGSQILDYSPILEAAGKVLSLVEGLQAEGFAMDHVDLGGGLGISYQPADTAPLIQDFIAALKDRLGRDHLTVMIEPGRSIVGNAGVLLTKVIQRKRSPSKEFVVVDAAMNDLIRPALYKAHHEIQPLRETEGSSTVDVVGPVCETGDFLARDRSLPNAQAGDYLAIFSAGAYGFTQASNYNSRPRAAEVLVEGNTWRVIRRRETWDDLIQGETK